MADKKPEAAGGDADKAKKPAEGKGQKPAKGGGDAAPEGGAPKAADAGAPKAEKKGGGEKKAGGDKKGAKPEKAAAGGPTEEKGPPPRLYIAYNAEVKDKLKAKFALSNVHQVPKLKKIVVNMGVGKAIENRKRLDAAMENLASITGQKPKLCNATRSEANFKLRQGMPIGCKVDLRGARMYEFFDRLVSVAIPRIRDFRGINRNSFDGRGNFSMGLAEQSVFPEVPLDKVEFPQGMDITMVISGGNDEMSLELLENLGMPFKRA